MVKYGKKKVVISMSNVEFKDERFENLKIEEKFNNNSTVRIYNVLTSEMLEKVDLYRSDPHCAKIKPE